MSQQRLALKNQTGWFAAGREVARAMALLSDGAFKVYIHVCLTADRSTGRLKMAQGDLAVALNKSRRSIVSYLEELREHVWRQVFFRFGDNYFSRCLSWIVTGAGPDIEGD